MSDNAVYDRLDAAAGAVAVGKPVAHTAEHLVPKPQWLAHDKVARSFQGLAYFFAAGHFADPGAARAVSQYEQVAGEEGAMRAAQVEQHAITASHRDDLQGGDAGRVGGIGREGGWQGVQGRGFSGVCWV